MYEGKSKSIRNVLFYFNVYMLLHDWKRSHFSTQSHWFSKHVWFSGAQAFHLNKQSFRLRAKPRMHRLLQFVVVGKSYQSIF